MDPADDQAVNFKLLVRRQKMHGPALSSSPLRNYGPHLSPALTVGCYRLFQLISPTCMSSGNVAREVLVGRPVLLLPSTDVQFVAQCLRGTLVWKLSQRDRATAA